MVKNVHSAHSYFPKQGILPLLKDNESKEKDKGNEKSRENQRGMPR